MENKNVHVQKENLLSKPYTIQTFFFFSIDTHTHPDEIKPQDFSFHTPQQNLNFACIPSQ